MKTNGYKKIGYFLIIMGITFISLDAVCQRNDCFEIKYLDHFGLQDADSLPMDVTAWRKLLDNKIPGGDKDAFFLIPFIISSIKSYHPSCNAKTDSSAYKILTSVYCKIRKIDMAVLRNKSITDQLEFLRNDFYQQVQNDSVLPYMKYTLDDGPFYGKDATYTNAKDNLVYLMDFGKLIIGKCSNDETCIIVIDQKDSIRWTKKMVKNNNLTIQNISLDKENIQKTSLGYTILMAGDGERLTLYLKDNGDFRFFFHFW